MSTIEVNTEARRWGCSPRVYATVKKCVFSLARKVDNELTLGMSFGSEFQTFVAATQNSRLAVSVRVHGTERRGASVDHRDRVVTWRCRRSSMYGRMEVDIAVCVMTAILYWKLLDRQPVKRL